MIGPRIRRTLQPGRVYRFLLDTIPAILLGLVFLWLLTKFPAVRDFLGL